jgi:mannose-6-phosphate isomerase-like protein (cupin superfamily)
VQLERKSLDSADEVHTGERGRGEVVHIAGVKVGRSTAQPGWRWSEDVKPQVGTESCQSTHFGVVVSGSMQIVMDDGTELVAKAGDVISIPPGHDAWVLGDEPCVSVDFSDALT